MKKLVFNGCSFMAGDELLWKQFHKEHNKQLLPWHDKIVRSMDDIDFRNKYIEYRKQFNLPAVVSKKLMCHHTDLSRDGKSNDTIAIETLAYINSIDKEERKNHHVIVGWTSLARIIKYSKINKHFIDLTGGHYHLSDSDPAKNALKNHIKTRILDGDDEDFILDYLKNIMLLEDNLISNNISYNFYSAVDDGLYEFKNIGPFNSHSFTTVKLKVEDCTNHNNWYKFDEQNTTPINGLGWNMIFHNKPHMCISPTNGHPGLSAIYDFSEKLTKFIKVQDIL